MTGRPSSSPSAQRRADPAARVREAAADVPPWRCSLDTYTCRQQQGRGGRGGRGGGGGLAGPVRPPFDINAVEPKPSPDKKFEALVSNYNVAIREVRPVGAVREPPLLTLLSTDGSEGGYFDPDSLVWSPDSKNDCRLQGEAGVPALRPLRRIVA